MVEGDHPARYLLLITPGGGEQYFVESGSPAEGSQQPPADSRALDRVKELAPKFGIEILAPLCSQGGAECRSARDPS